MNDADMPKKPASGGAVDFLKNLFGFSIAAWVSVALGLVATPITTRLFLPDEVGRINLFATYLSLMLYIGMIGLDQAFTRFYHEPLEGNNEKGLFRISLLLSGGWSLLLCIPLLVWGQVVSIEITGRADPIIPVFLAMSLLANLLLRFTSQAARMRQNILLFSLQTISLTVVGRLLYVVVALWKPIHQYAIGAMTAGYVLVALVFFTIESFDRKKVQVRWSRKTLSALLKYGVPLVPVTVLVWLNNSLSQLMLNRYVDFSAIGIYTNGVAVAGLLGLLQTGFAVYWTPFVYRNYRSDPDAIRKVHRLITFAMVAFGLLIVLGQDVLYLVIGPNFRASKEFFPFLMLSPICYTIAETTGLGINLSKKTWLNLITFSVNAGVNLLLCVLLLPWLGISGAAIAAGVSAIVMLVLRTLIGERYFRCVTSYPKTFSAILVATLMAAANLVFFGNPPVRYAVTVSLLALLCLVYREEVVYLGSLARRILSENIAPKLRRKPR